MIQPDNGREFTGMARRASSHGAEGEEVAGVDDALVQQVSEPSHAMHYLH